MRETVIKKGNKAKFGNTYNLNKLLNLQTRKEYLIDVANRFQL